MYTKACFLWINLVSIDIWMLLSFGKVVDKRSGLMCRKMYIFRDSPQKMLCPHNFPGLFTDLFR